MSDEKLLLDLADFKEARTKSNMYLTIWGIVNRANGWIPEIASLRTRITKAINTPVDYMSMEDLVTEISKMSEEELAAKSAEIISKCKALVPKEVS